MSSPSRPPPPDRPYGTPAIQPAAQSRTGRTGLLPGLISVLVYVLAIIPVLSIVSLPLGYVCGVLAIVLAVRALRRPGSKTRPVLGLAFGVAGIAFSLIVTVVAMWMWPEITAYTSCDSKANTIAEHDACSADFSDDVSTKVEQTFGLEPGSIKVNQRP